MIPIVGLHLERDEQAIILRSEAPLTILSSAVVGGGLTSARVIINRHVSKYYDHPHPEKEMLLFAVNRGIQEPFVGLMTAVFTKNMWIGVETGEEVAVVLILTAGFSNTISSGLSAPIQLHPGTINMILLIDAALTPAAMVNAVITATEAKTASIHRWSMLTDEGLPATGTSTDAIVVACTGRGPVLPYAGPVTPVGAAIARLIRRGMEARRPGQVEG